MSYLHNRCIYNHITRWSSDKWYLTSNSPQLSQPRVCPCGNIVNMLCSKTIGHLQQSFLIFGDRISTNSCQHEYSGAAWFSLWRCVYIEISQGHGSDFVNRSPSRPCMVCSPLFLRTSDIKHTWHATYVICNAQLGIKIDEHICSIYHSLHFTYSLQLRHSNVRKFVYRYVTFVCIPVMPCRCFYILLYA